MAMAMAMAMVVFGAAIVTDSGAAADVGAAVAGATLPQYSGD